MARIDNQHSSKRLDAQRSNLPFPPVNRYLPSGKSFKSVAQSDAHPSSLDTGPLQEALDALQDDLDRMEARIIACVERALGEEDAQGQAHAE